MSGVQVVEEQYGLPVVAIANLQDLFAMLQNSGNGEISRYLPQLTAYRERYGVA